MDNKHGYSNRLWLRVHDDLGIRVALGIVFLFIYETNLRKHVYICVYKWKLACVSSIESPNVLVLEGKKYSDNGNVLAFCLVIS